MDGKEASNTIAVSFHFKRSFVCYRHSRPVRNSPFPCFCSPCANLGVIWMGDQQLVAEDAAQPLGEDQSELAAMPTRSWVAGRPAVWGGGIPFVRAERKMNGIISALI